MAFDISLSAGMRSDLISLQGTAKLLNRTQGRLSSGKNVNSAVDDPSKFFAAEDHTNHAGDLSARKSDMGEAIQAVKAANQGITSITTLINQARGLVQSAQSANSTTRASLAKQFNDLRDQIDQLAADSGYNGKNFLQADTLKVLFNETGSSQLTVTGFNGDSTGLGIAAAAKSTGVAHVAEVAAANTAALNSTYTLAHSGTVAKTDLVITQTVSLKGESLVASKASAGAVSGTSVTLQHAGQATGVKLVETMAVTSAAVLSAGAVSAGAMSAGATSAGAISATATPGFRIQLTSTMSAAPTSVTVTAAGNVTPLVSGTDYTTSFDSSTHKLTLTMKTTQSAAINVDYSYKKTLSAGSDYSVSSGGTATAGQINFLRNVSGTSISVDYTFKGAVASGNYSVAGGAASGRATVTFTAKVSGSVDVAYSTNSTVWGSDTSITKDLDNLNNAINNLRTQASTLAANLSVITTRQDWSQGMIDNLQQGADNLTLADMNEEGANMLALQTRQQLGIQALSLASQANQSIMRLFG